MREPVRDLQPTRQPEQERFTQPHTHQGFSASALPSLGGWSLRWGCSVHHRVFANIAGLYLLYPPDPRSVCVHM